MNYHQAEIQGYEAVCENLVDAEFQILRDSDRSLKRVLFRRPAFELPQIGVSSALALVYGLQSKQASRRRSSLAPGYQDKTTREHNSTRIRIQRIQL
jgi:hypothetical protein